MDNKRKKNRYPGIKYEGLNKFGQHVYKVSYYPYPDVRKWATLNLEKKSDKEANLKKQELILKYRLSNKQSVNINKQELPFGEVEICLEEIMEAEKLRPKTINRGISSFRTFFYQFLKGKFPNIKCMRDFPEGIFTDYMVYFSKLENRRQGWPSEAISFKAMMRRLIRGGYGRKDLLDELKLIKTPSPNVKDLVILTKKEIKLILQEMKKKREDFWGVTYFNARTGWRISEILSIRKEYIKMENGQPVEIVVPQSARKTKEKFFFRQIDRHLADVIMYFYKTYDSEWLFPNMKGNKISYNHYNVALGKLSEKVIGRRVTAHHFRHTIVTSLLDAGMTPKNIMSITGHKDLEVFIRHYSHITEKGSAAAMKLTDLDT